MGSMFIKESTDPSGNFTPRTWKNILTRWTPVLPQQMLKKMPWTGLVVSDKTDNISTITYLSSKPLPSNQMQEKEWQLSIYSRVDWIDPSVGISQATDRLLSYHLD